MSGQEQVNVALSAPAPQIITGATGPGKITAREGLEAAPAGQRLITIEGLPELAVESIAFPRPVVARPLSEWHEDHGNVVWWYWTEGAWAGEPAWIGSPLDEDWPDYHTHWTPHPVFPTAIENFDPSLHALGVES